MSDNPSAFPVMFNDGHICAHEVGMTLRDYFAAAALQGTLSAGDCPSSNAGVASWAYNMADAMLTQRNKQ